jgi:hypothetical protein
MRKFAHSPILYRNRTGRDSNPYPKEIPDAILIPDGQSLVSHESGQEFRDRWQNLLEY